MPGTELAACMTLASKNDMQLFEYRSVRYWSKEINETRTGGPKGNFLIRGAEADEATGRARRWNPVNPCPLGVPGVA